ncbi:type VI secretion protein [Burkholderia sp. SRS-W-2-2016]|uniref:TraI domain-containing protein n=1 Tax=Burkholderia sp. SRS-W-2-2016 TaxID=1926878 RepID=UPI00094AE3B6|nr:TraI domain-containing protein [Burkholderia sp. SRS-W-2-2016]OLL30085.1 type VI secretion protein [Burkholderia sp. SRS-W-2-2016]
MTAHTPMTVDTLIGEYQRRVDLIAQCANEASQGELERKWLAVLRACASWFSSLPLSPDLYRESGGAFRATIETAFYAMRLAGGQKFGTNLTSEKRRRIEPQYNYAVFLAAVCSRLDEPYRHFATERDRDRAMWNPPVHGQFGPWLAGSSYRLTRRDTPLPVERMRTGMLAQMLVGSGLLAGLDAEVLAELFGAINPNMRPIEAESLLHKVVRQGVSTADEFDRKAQRGVFAPVQFAVPSAVHVAAELEPVTTPGEPVTGASATAAPHNPAPTSGTPVSPAQTESAATPASAGTPPPAMVVDPSTGEVLPASVSADTAPVQSPAPVSAAVDPAAMRSPAPTTSIPKASNASAFDEVLKGVPGSVREFFQALSEDVASGKAAVQWTGKGLVVPKRLIGSYGIAASTLVEHMRKRSLMVADASTEVTLAPRAGQLILASPA